MREDIVSALRNAIERGFSMQEAKKSLVNSGYKAEEVEEAVRYASGAFRPQTPAQEIKTKMPEGIPELASEKMPKPGQSAPETKPQITPRPEQKPEPKQPPAYQRPPTPVSALQIQKPQTVEPRPQMPEPPQAPQPKPTQQPKQQLPIQPPKLRQPIQEKPKKKSGLIILFIILAILIGITIFILFAKDAVFDFFSEVIDKFGG